MAARTKKNAAPKTQADRKAESDSKIIEAAIELFAEQGYIKTTLNQIGSEAGYTGGLVSKHFGSKALLLHRVLEDIFEGFKNESSERVGKTYTVIEALDVYVDLFFERITKSQTRVRALYVVMGESFGAVSEISDAVRHFNRSNIEVLAKIIQEGIDSGELRADLSAKEAATIVLGLMRGLTYLKMSDNDAIKPRSIKSEVHNLIMSFHA